MEITAEEQQRGELFPQSLELACQRLSEIGYVIFEQVLPFSFMEEVREAFEAILNRIKPTNQGPFQATKERLYHWLTFNEDGHLGRYWQGMTKL